MLVMPESSDPDRNDVTPGNEADESALDSGSDDVALESEAGESAEPERKAIVIFIGDMGRGTRFIGRLLWGGRKRRALTLIVGGVIVAAALLAGTGTALWPQLRSIMETTPALPATAAAEPTPTSAPSVVVIKAVLPTPTPSAMDRAVTYRTPVAAGTEVATSVPVEAQVSLGVVRAFPVATATPTPLPGVVATAQSAEVSPPPAGPTGPPGTTRGDLRRRSWPGCNEIHAAGEGGGSGISDDRHRGEPGSRGGVQFGGEEQGWKPDSCVGAEVHSRQLLCYGLG